MSNPDSPEDTENAERSDNPEPGDISDDQLPEDLQPTEDNPLARDLDEEDAEVDDLDLLDGGKPAEQWDDEDLED
ncbi:hypothetical protein ACFP3Q_10825 [Nocardioides sp. GCM10027113]|uniref:hypothetical protein n=1 Tax=unclassified Nocardioides TaxID=2615069 RepID=UPI003611E0CB